MVLGVAIVIVMMMEAAGVRAQDAGSISGTVTMSGEGVPGVRIELPALAGAAITDQAGRYELLSIPAGRHEMRADFVGCRSGSWTLEVPVGRPLTFDLQLGGPAVEPARMVRAGVVGETPDVELPFTVERLTRAQIERNPGRSVADLIRGAFPGVKVVQGSGLPGTDPAIQLRGPTSLSVQHQPMLVVDGFIIGGGLDDLDPLDIESIEVLKGSVASALYGSRGEAGVISIETRNGAASSGGCFFRGGPSS